MARRDAIMAALFLYGPINIIVSQPRSRLKCILLDKFQWPEDKTNTQIVQGIKLIEPELVV